MPLVSLAITTMRGTSSRTIGLVMQVFGWDSAGKIEISNTNCITNTAGEDGGCFHSSGDGVIANGTVMQDNKAVVSGGGMCECKPKRAT